MKHFPQFPTYKIGFLLIISIICNILISGQELKSRPNGSDLVKLNGTFDVPTTNSDGAKSSEAISAVIGDLDADGFNELIIGRNGSITIQRGDINAFAPQTQAAWEAIRDLQFISPFQSETRSFELPFQADFLQIGDFTRDGKVDVIAASRSSNILILLEGDGIGNFNGTREIFIGGNITAMTVGDVNRLDGLPDVIVASGNEVSIYQGLGNIFNAEAKRISVSNLVETIAIGQLDASDFADIAVGNGNQISIISGSDGENEVSNLTQNYFVKSMIVGDFVPDRAFRQEIAAIDEGGTIHIIVRGDLDTRPVSSREHLADQVREMLAKNMPVPQRILSKVSQKDLREPKPIIESKNQTWAEYDQFFGVEPNATASSNSILTSGKLSNYGEDLIVLDSASKEIVVMPLVFNEDTSEKVSYVGRRQTVKFSLENAPLAAFVSRLNFDGDKDLLVLENGKVEPTTFLTAPEAAFTVNNAGDAPDANPGNGVCATAGAVCTLRAAIMEANHLPGTDSITINSGINITLSTGSPDNDSNGVFNFEGGGDLDITCAINAGGDTCNAPLATNVNNLTITGAAGGNTIAVGTFTASPPITSTTDRVFDIGFDGLFGGGFGAGTGLQVTMSNLTIQNGNVREDFNAGGGGFGNFARGGAIRLDGFGQGGTRGTLTLTSVTINNNQADHDTGGVFNQFASISFTSVTATTNIGKAGPGGALAFLASTPATLSVANSTFTSNEARTGPVFAGTALDVDGGAIAANHDSNVGTITNTNFSNNISHDDGGALKAFSGAITVTGGTMSGNTARDDGGAVWGDNDTVSGARFLTLSGVTLQNNRANSDNSGGGDGGAVFRDRGTLNVTNCIIGGVAALQPNNALNGGGIAHAFRAAVTPSNQTTINIDNGSITGNNATTDGGGVFINATNQNVGTPSVLNVGATTNVAVTENNSNVHGGGFAVSGGVNDTLTRATFMGNDADSDANGSGDGGGLFHNNSGGTTTIASTVSFTNNGNGTTTTENGGAIHHSNGTLTLNSPTVSGNDADVQGGGLFVSGGTVNVNGVTFSANTFPANAAEVRLTGGTTNFSNTVTIPGELSIAGGTLAAGSSTVTLGEDFNFSSGTFTAGTSTFNFNGAAAQQIYGGSVPTFNNLTNSNTAAQLSVNNNANANGNLTVNANATLNPAAASVIGGTGTLTGSGTARVTRTAATADFLSQYTITNKTLTNLLVDYVGSSAQTVSAITYGGLRLNNAAGASLASGTTTVNSTLLLTNGTLGVGTNTLVVNNGITVTSGTFSSAATGTVNYNQGSNGQVVLAGNYGNLTFSNFNKVLPGTTVGIAGTFTPGSAVGHTVAGSNINFNGTSAQTVPVFPYEGLTIANAASASLGGNVTVNGSLGLASGVLAVGTNTLTLNSTVAATGGSLSSSATGTVNYNQGSDGQTVLAANYGNLTFSNFNKTLPSSTVGIAGTFTTGTATGHTITGNTINFNGASAQTIPAFQYNNLTSSSTGGRTLANSGTIGVLAVFTPGTNAYTVTGSTINFNGAGAQGIPASLYNNLTTSTGGVKTTSGAVNVNGNATVGAGTTLVVATASTFTVAGTLTSSGTIQGLGTIVNNFSNGGALAPGLSPGILNITGNFANTGSFNVEIGGTGGAGVNPNGHDQLLVSGTATIGGTLNVTLTNGFTPMPGNSFVILDAASSTGTFATTNFPDIFPNQWRVFYDNATGTVTVNVQAPTAAAVSVSGRVLSPQGRGLPRSQVLVTSSTGEKRKVVSNSFGYYQINDLPVGETYVLRVISKQYSFTPRVVTVLDNISNLDFVAEPLP
jgi:CSLREA domain-containing protein